MPENACPEIQAFPVTPSHCISQLNLDYTKYTIRTKGDQVEGQDESMKTTSEKNL